MQLKTETESQYCRLCRDPLKPEEHEAHVSCIDEFLKAVESGDPNKVNRLIRNFNQSIENLDFNFTRDKTHNFRFGNIFDRMMNRTINTISYYDRRIGSNSEVANCNDLVASNGDFTLDNGKLIDRDAGATIYDSYVNHNCNVDRSLTPNLLYSMIMNIKHSRRLCLVTGNDTFMEIIQLLHGCYFYDFLDALEHIVDQEKKDKLIEDMKIPHITEWLNIGYYYISDLCLKDTISRIYFINIDDPYIEEPNLHGKIRDIQ